MFEHALTFGVDRKKRLQLAPLTGAAERAAAGDAQALLRALMSKVAVDRLTIGDRDRVLAALYTALYGADVLADAHCAACAARFELRFSLTDLVASRRPDGSASGDPPTVDMGKARLRLPRCDDRAATPEGLIDLLLIEGDAPPLEEAEAALEAADPALEIDLASICPECGNDQAMPFSIAGFLSAALLRDYRFLMREVHVIARCYGWAFETILGLTRDERQQLVRLILADQGAGGRAWRRAS